MNPFLTLGIALGLGLLIGLQRQRTDSRFGGIRTFPLISLFGAFCGMLAQSYGGWPIGAGLLAILATLAIANWFAAREHETERGQTTEVAALLTFAIGAYLPHGDASLAAMAAGLTVILLHLKQPMHTFVEKMGPKDMTGLMQFVVVSLIILPLLPNRPFGPFAVLNPYDIWRMVVLIVALSLIGYVIYKVIGGTASTLIGGVLGGLISSTATTVSYSRRSREAPDIHRLALFVVMIASAIAYARVLIEIAAVAPRHFTTMALPLGAMLGWMLSISGALYFLVRGDSAAVPEPHNPAELKSALVFGALYAVVILAVGAAKQHLGPGALYGIAIVSGLTDMDAITLSIARMVDKNRIDPLSGWQLILVASLSNLIFKAGIAIFLGGPRFGLRVLLAFAIALAGGLTLLLLWP